MSTALEPLPDAPLSASLPAPLPAKVSAALWRACELGMADRPVVASGHAALDAALPGGGWPCGALTDCLQAQDGLLEWRLLGPALAPLLAKGGTLLLVGPPLQPHLPGLRKLGIHEQQVVWVDVSQPAQRLWVAEQAIKARAKGAVLAWLPQARPAQIRRLQVCAQGGTGPVFLFRPASEQATPSAAPLRLLLSIGARGGLEVRVLKRRGAAHEGVIALASWPAPLHRVLAHRLGRDAPDTSPEGCHAMLDRTDSPLVHGLV